jgi:hypothetical protein
MLAALLGVVSGRVFAIEGGRRPSSVFAAAYVGAGVGLIMAVLIGPLLALAGQFLNAESATWFDALDVAGFTLLWGAVAGASGGLAVGIVIMLLPAGWFQSSPRN